MSIKYDIIVAGVPTDAGLFGIGFKGQIPWRVPEDIRYFRKITWGHTVIMGRKTWESIPAEYRPLAGRTNIVISRSATPNMFHGAHFARNISEALTLATASQSDMQNTVFLIGGTELYREFLRERPNDWCRLYLTRIHQGDWPSVYDAHFDLDWVPNRVLVSVKTTPEALYEIYERR